MKRTPRPKMTGIYLSDKERSLLEELADEAGMTMSAFVRQLIRQADIERKTIHVPHKQRAVEYAQ